MTLAWFCSCAPGHFSAFSSCFSTLNVCLPPSSVLGPVTLFHAPPQLLSCCLIHARGSKSWLQRDDSQICFSRHLTSPRPSPSPSLSPPPTPAPLSNLDSWIDVPPGKLHWDALQSSQTPQVQMELLLLTKHAPPTTFPISGADNAIHAVVQDLDTLVCHHTYSQSHLPLECFKSIYFSPSSPAVPHLGHRFLSWRLF